TKVGGESIQARCAIKRERCRRLFRRTNCVLGTARKIPTFATVCRERLCLHAPGALQGHCETAMVLSPTLCVEVHNDGFTYPIVIRLDGVLAPRASRSHQVPRAQDAELGEELR